MISLSFESRIWTEYHKGAQFTKGRKYRYSIQYNPLAFIHTWIVRQPINGGSWEWVKPVRNNLDFKPRNSVR